jgi:hypothetical protein
MKFDICSSEIYMFRYISTKVAMTKKLSLFFMDIVKMTVGSTILSFLK